MQNIKQCGSVEKNLPAVWETGSIPGSGRSPGEGSGYPLQYSCLENPMDRGAWWATVHGGHKKSDKTERLTLSCVCVFGFYCPTIIKYTEGRVTAGHVTHAEDGIPTCTERYSRHREKNHWHNDTVCMSARHQLPQYRCTQDTSFDNCDNCSILYNYEDHFGLWELSQQLCVRKIEACYSSRKFSLFR